MHFYGDVITIDEYDSSGVLDGDTLNITNFSYTSEIGRNDIVVTEWNVSDGINDRTNFYEISKVSGSIIINKKPITVAIYKKTKVYDGTSLGLSLSDYYLKEGELVGSQTITFIPSTDTLTNVGEKIVSFTEDNLKISDSFSDDYKNYYSITYEEGMLKVIPRQLVVTSLSKSKPYDYGVLTCHEYTISGLVSTEEAEVTFKSELFYIGSINNEIEEVKVYTTGEDKVDVTSNYSISTYEGTLTYTERSE